MIERLPPAQRRFFFECAAMAVVALVWLGSLVSGLGGARASQAISNFGLIAAAGAAGITCIRTARFSSPRQAPPRAAGRPGGGGGGRGPRVGRAGAGGAGGAGACADSTLVSGSYILF